MNLTGNLKGLGLLLFLSGATGADELSGYGRTTLAELPWGTVFCSEDCKVRTDPDGRRWRLETPKGYVSVFRSGDTWLIQAPNQNLKLEPQDGKSLQVAFNSSQHTVQIAPNSAQWQAGRGFVPQRIDSTRYRGIVFDNEVVGFYLKLPVPSGEKAASWSDLFVVENMTHFPVFQQRLSSPSAAPKPASTAGDPDPLRLRRGPFDATVTVEEAMSKEPENDWSYPEGAQQKPSAPMQAIEAPKGKDPLNLRPAPFKKTPTIFEAQKKNQQKR